MLVGLQVTQSDGVTAVPVWQIGSDMGRSGRGRWVKFRVSEGRKRVMASRVEVIVVANGAGFANHCIPLNPL